MSILPTIPQSERVPKNKPESKTGENFASSPGWLFRLPRCGGVWFDGSEPDCLSFWLSVLNCFRSCRWRALPPLPLAFRPSRRGDSQRLSCRDTYVVSSGLQAYSKDSPAGLAIPDFR